MSRLIILADDFTGACDAAGAFSAAGLGPTVLLETPHEAPPYAEVAAIDLDVRERPAGETYARARTAAESVSRWGRTRLFAKIDSTLRGELGAFVGGVLAGSSLRGALISPAFPEQGRFLVGGRLRLDGSPNETAVPALPDRLAVSGLRAAAVQLAVACSGGEELQREVERLRDSGANAIVVDADTPACLDHVAELWWRCADSLLLAGSAGIARRVAGLRGRESAGEMGSGRRGDGESVGNAGTRRRGGTDGERRGDGERRRGEGRSDCCSASLLVVAGTPAVATLRQLNELLRLPNAMTLHAGPGSPMTDDVIMPEGSVLILRAAPTAPAGMPMRDRGEYAEAVADACARLARTYRPGGVVLTGGATARLVCERLGVQAVRVIGEISPGVPHGVLIGGVWDGVAVVTKAGGFGGPSQLLDAIRWLGVSWEQSR